MKKVDRKDKKKLREIRYDLIIGSLMNSNLSKDDIAANFNVSLETVDNIISKEHLEYTSDRRTNYKLLNETLKKDIEMLLETHPELKSKYKINWQEYIESIESKVESIGNAPNRIIEQAKTDKTYYMHVKPIIEYLTNRKKEKLQTEGIKKFISVYDKIKFPEGFDANFIAYLFMKYSLYRESDFIWCNSATKGTFSLLGVDNKYELLEGYKSFPMPIPLPPDIIKDKNPHTTKGFIYLNPFWLSDFNKYENPEIFDLYRSPDIAIMNKKPIFVSAWIARDTYITGHVYKKSFLGFISTKFSGSEILCTIFTALLFSYLDLFFKYFKGHQEIYNSLEDTRRFLLLLFLKFYRHDDNKFMAEFSNLNFTDNLYKEIKALMNKNDFNILPYAYLDIFNEIEIYPLSPLWSLNIHKEENQYLHWRLNLLKLKVKDNQELYNDVFHLAFESYHNHYQEKFLSQIYSEPMVAYREDEHSVIFIPKEKIYLKLISVLKQRLIQLQNYV